MMIFRRNPAAKLQRLHFKYTAISCEDPGLYALATSAASVGVKSPGEIPPRIMSGISRAGMNFLRAVTKVRSVTSEALRPFACLFSTFHSLTMSSVQL